jgi:hypothetical protein
MLLLAVVAVRSLHRTVGILRPRIPEQRPEACPHEARAVNTRILLVKRPTGWAGLSCFAVDDAPEHTIMPGDVLVQAL